ncbi:MAG: PRC-barrel domain-containing protein [Gammaproteobacteria bacterium]
MAADTLAGDPVVNRQGENLGEIRDIMIDVRTGGVGYAVLSFGGVLGTEDKLFAIPWNLLILDVDNQQFILDVPKGRLEKAPGFDEDHWPMMADQQVMHRPENTTSINRAVVLRDQAKLLTINKQTSRRHMRHA